MPPPTPAPPDARIAVVVAHDNLTNATSPVLVSHYRQDVIVAAEAQLDRQLDRRLSELLRMELYPGPIHTGVVVLNEPAPDGTQVHPGAIVAGLGNVGELTPGSLAATLSHALTMYGSECVGQARRRHQRDGVPLPATISAPVTAILVGSGEGGLSLTDSVRALLRAVLQANQRLSGGTRSVEGTAVLSASIDRLEILELFEDRAIEAQHILLKLVGVPEFAVFAAAPFLVKGRGGQRRVRFEQADGWWQRIRIEGDDGALKFEAVTHAARAPARLRPTQRGLVDGFVEQALASTANDPAIGQTLFELLVPDDFKPYAADRRKLALMMNTDAAALPWELVRDGFERNPEPLSVSGGMIRQLLVEGERAEVLRAPSNTALVIGNPIVSDDRFSSLPGAAAEATTVAGLLSDSGYDVKFLLEEAADPLSVLSAIHDRPWRVLHLAAHGVFEFDTEHGPVSGLVLDNGLYFTAAEADQLRFVPELVFINCCHLGQMSGEGHQRQRTPFHRLAANLATQFIRIGARAVVAAGWEVDDDAAGVFAAAFYRAMLDGALYGDAVLEARRATYGAHGDTNTWGAYQCYGDASFSLTVARDELRDESFVSESELTLWLERLASSARDAADDQRAALLESLEKKAAKVPAEWFASGHASARAAAAYAACGELAKAIEHYTRALQASASDAPISAAEDLARCRLDRALAIGAAEQADDEAIASLVRDAQETLEGLVAVGSTRARWALLGRAAMRRATLRQDASSRRAALRRMRDAFREAAAPSTAGDAVPDAHLDELAADVALSWMTPDDAKKGSLHALRAAIGKLNVPPDAALLSALVDRAFDADARERVRLALRAVAPQGRAPAPFRLRLAFFTTLAGLALPADTSAGIVEQLSGLAEDLEKE